MTTEELAQRIFINSVCPDELAVQMVIEDEEGFEKAQIDSLKALAKIAIIAAEAFQVAYYENR